MKGQNKDLVGILLILILAFFLLLFDMCENKRDKCKECISVDLFQNKKIECTVLKKERYDFKRGIPLYILTLKSADSIFKIDTDKFPGYLYEKKGLQVGETILIENKDIKRVRVNGSWGKIVDKYKRECPEEEFILVIKFPDTLMTINDKKMYYDWGVGGEIFKMEDGKLKNTDVLFEINNGKNCK